MLAVIRRLDPERATGSLPIAGRPLIVRQLQWLRHHGFDRVIVETRRDQAGALAESFLREYPAFARDVQLVEGINGEDVSALVARARLAPPERFVIIDDTTLGGADLSWLFRRAGATGTIRATANAPAGWEGQQAPKIELFDARATQTSPSTSMSPSTSDVQIPGWAVSIAHAHDALHLGTMALNGLFAEDGDQGQAPIILHGSVAGDGVWVARGAHIHKGARLVGPVFVGADAVIYAGAEVGPNVDVGAGVVVEPGARIRDAILSPDTVIGEGLLVSEAMASPEGLTPLPLAPLVLPLNDAMLLDRRRTKSGMARAF